MLNATRLNDRDLDRLDVDEIRRFLARRWRLILATALGCVILAAIVCVTVTPVYTATSQVLLDPRKQNVFGTDTVSQDAVLDSSIVDSQIPIILSTRVLAKVIAKEKLADDPEFAAPEREGLIDRLFGLFAPSHAKSVESPAVDGMDPTLAPVILRLFNKVDVTRVAKSNVLSISVSSRDPEMARRLADRLARTYVEDQVDVHAQSVQQTATFFEKRLGRLRDQVRESESAIAEFRKANHLSTTSMDGKITVGEQQLQSLNEEFAKISADTAEKLAKYQQAVRFKSSGTNLDTLPDMARSPVIAQLRGQEADIDRRESDLAAMYGPSYPALAQIHAQRAGLEWAIGAEIKRLTWTLKNDYDVAKAREASFRATILALSDASGGDNEVGVKLRELERANLANRALFENFLNRAKLTQEQSTFEEPEARVISPALEPTSPSSPKTKLVLPVAGIAGLLLGLGLAALLDIPRRREDVVLKPPLQSHGFIIGKVPFVGRHRNADLSAYLDQNPRSDFAQSLDTLVAKFATGDAGDGRVVALSPLSRGEGATSIALCLARSAWKAGKRVLLIDADPAGRGLTRIADAIGQPGLAEVIKGDLAAPNAVMRRQHYAILPIGQAPLALAGAIRPLQALLEEARRRFDLVLIDTSAFEADSVTLAALSDGFVLVTSWDELMRDNLAAAIESVADMPGFAGVILNRATAADDEALALAS